MEPRRARPRLRDGLLALYVLACLGAMTWPGYALVGNSIGPRILGLPFSLAWVLGWVLLTFLVLALYHRSRERGGPARPER